MKAFAERIKILRNQLGKNQAEFAQMLEVSAPTLSAWEKGSKDPATDKVVQVAEKCNVSLDWLFGLSEQQTITTENTTIKTMADLFSILLNLAELKTVTIDASYDSSQGATDKSYACQSGNHWIPYAEIRIWDNKPLADFCKDWRKLRELEMKGALPDGVYKIYIEQKLKELKNQPIPVPVHFEEDS